VPVDAAKQRLFPVFIGIQDRFFQVACHSSC
jgi:hypothetical protein